MGKERLLRDWPEWIEDLLGFQVRRQLRQFGWLANER